MNKFHPLIEHCKHQALNRNIIYLDFYDSVASIRKALRGELSSDGGYTATGGGSITTLITLPDTNTSRTYDLDGLGNWKQSDYVPVGGTATTDLRQHNKLNEITSRKVDGDAKVLFVYDKNGNLKDDGTLLFSYDALNRLIQVNRKSNGQKIAEYYYDALERRTSKTVSNGGLTGNVPNGNTKYFYRGWQVVEERDGSDNTTKQYVWGQYIDECIQLKTLTTTGPQSLLAGDYYPLQDLLYRTTALTDDSGDIVEAYDYDAYGNTLIFKTAGTGGNWWADNATQANYGACDVLYCGYRYDPECKTYQVRYREYNPTLGRFVQRDLGVFSNVTKFYLYTGDKPVSFIDTNGLSEVKSIEIGGSVGAWDVLGLEISPSFTYKVTDCCDKKTGITIAGGKRTYQVKVEIEGGIGIGGEAKAFGVGLGTTLKAMRVIIDPILGDCVIDKCSNPNICCKMCNSAAVDIGLSFSATLGPLSSEARATILGEFKYCYDLGPGCPQQGFALGFCGTFNVSWSYQVTIFKDTHNLPQMQSGCTAIIGSNDMLE